MNKFNLTEEPWIPCLMLNTNELRELSLFDVLASSHEIQEILDDSPLVAISLHRLLLAILHRNFGPKNFDEWKELWRRKSWDERKLNEYFERYKNKFNLFDEERPFYQYPHITKKAENKADLLPIEALMQEKASGNNATLFDHSFEANPQAVSPAKAARYLVARQAYSFGGGVSFPFNFSNAVLTSGFSVLANGKNLFETLALNLVIYHRDKPIPVQDDDDDIKDVPFWERKEADQATENDKNGTLPRGYLDYLTWQSRRIKLIRDEKTQEVKYCQNQQNFKLKEAGTLFDPFKVYVSGESGYYGIKLQEDRSLWRNSHTLVQQATSIENRSSLFNHLAKIESFVRNGEIEGVKNHHFSIFGVINKEANVKAWRKENLPIKLELLDDDSLLIDLENAVRFAEDIGFVLEISMKTLRREINIQAWESAIKSVKPQDRPKREKQLANQFPALPHYWSSLELLFQCFADSLVSDRQKAVGIWFEGVQKTAKDALSSAIKSLGGTVADQKAIVKATKKFYELRGNLINGQPTYQTYLPEKTEGGSL